MIASARKMLFSGAIPPESGSLTKSHGCDIIKDMNISGLYYMVEDVRFFPLLVAFG